MFARESKKQMADRRKLSLGNEEKLSFQVKKFPCLFDKTDKGYKEKIVQAMHGKLWLIVWIF